MTDAWHLMGILNVTPDSFSDGGQFLSVDAARHRAERLREEGADSIDVGGESSRPGAVPVPADIECARVVPVIRAIRRDWPAAVISIDTTKSLVAQAAIDAGATIVNDISAGISDLAMLPCVAAAGVRYVMMHMQGTPATMQQAPQYRHVLPEVRDFLAARLAACETAGIVRTRCLIDPGFGFGKQLEHNVALVNGLSALQALDVPILIGLSRKSMLGQVLGGAEATDRLEAALAMTARAYEQGARWFRTHDVKATRRFLMAYTYDRTAIR